MITVSEHKTKTIPMKMIAVDKGIIPIVNWLNSYSYIFTQFSCEGDDESSPNWDKNNKGNINSVFRPYIQFITNSFANSDENGSPRWKREFIRVLDLLKEYGDFDKDDDSNSINGRLSYFCFRFTDKHKMREFIKNEIQ